MTNSNPKFVWRSVPLLLSLFLLSACRHIPTPCEIFKAQNFVVGEIPYEFFLPRRSASKV
jgi:hypothetical protein